MFYDGDNMHSKKLSSEDLTFNLIYLMTWKQYPMTEKFSWTYELSDLNILFAEIFSDLTW
jgi:hypothetical protein